MKKKYLPIQKMLLQFNDFVAANKSILEANPVAWEIITQIQNFGPQLEEAKQQQSYDFTGLAATKKQKKQALSRSLNVVMNLLYNDCLKKEKMDDINNFKGTENQLLTLQNMKLIGKAKHVIKYCEELEAELAGTGISTEMFDAVKTNTQKFEANIPLPQEMKKTSKMATEKIEVISQQITMIFGKRLNKVMESFFKDQNPELYNSYLLAAEKESTPTRKLAVRGTVLNKINHKPVPQARILIPKAGINHLCRNEKGGFRIKSLDPGTYEVEVKAVNYQSLYLTLAHHYGETNVLDILLEPTIVNNGQ